MLRLCNYLACSLLLISLFPLATRAADVLHFVPNDADAFVIVKNLEAADAKASRVLTTLHIDMESPLAIFRSVTNIHEGLDASGDALIVVLPTGADELSEHFCIWIPTTDYKQFIGSLGSASSEVDGITAVTVADEDLLIARQGKWALVMDPEQRSRMQTMMATSPSPSAQLAGWKNWIDTNDVTAVLMTSGVRSLLRSASVAEVEFHLQDQARNADDLFGAGTPDGDAIMRTQSGRGSTRGEVYTLLRDQYRKWVTASPILQQWVAQTSAIACGVRLDANGNAICGVRLAIAGDLNIARDNGQSAPEPELPASLQQDGEFVARGAGVLPPSIFGPLTTAYVKNLVDELRVGNNLHLDEETIDDLLRAAERASADVTAAQILMRPGSKEDGVYTNNFMVVRTKSSQDFAEHVAECMQIWNRLNLDAEGDARLVFELQQMKLGERSARKYSIDIAAADGAPQLPEIRQAMEKLFGPGGKMQLWVVPVDEKTALLAMATDKQVAEALELLDRKQAINWNDNTVVDVNRLLPAEADWRLFFSPHHYYSWLRRETDAVVGTEVIGGPLVREFAASPPCGVAAGTRPGEVWLDFVVPAATLQAGGSHTATPLVPVAR